MCPGTVNQTGCLLPVADRAARRLCAGGIRRGAVCCGGSCRACGSKASQEKLPKGTVDWRSKLSWAGKACHTRPGGAAQCCEKEISASGTVCTAHEQTGCLVGFAAQTTHLPMSEDEALAHAWRTHRTASSCRGS
jgi:hypothetical protein